eukprot:4546963-Pleurochrysis_carterae.AAC.1
MHEGAHMSHTSSNKRVQCHASRRTQRAVSPAVSLRLQGELWGAASLREALAAAIAPGNAHSVAARV